MATTFAARRRLRSLFLPVCTVLAYVACGSPFSGVTTADHAGGAAGNEADSFAGESVVASAGNASGGKGSDAGAPNVGEVAGETGVGCTTDSACGDGSNRGVCAGGTCAPCQEPADDDACVAAYGKGTLCIAGSCTAAQCRADDECAGGKLCVNNQCIGCKRDTECTDPGTVCNVDTGTCVTSDSCGAAVNGAACPINPNDRCCGVKGVCAAVECCGTELCKTSASSPTPDGTCQTGKCVLNGCLAPTGATRYVDLGAKAGGSGSKSCPYNDLVVAFDDLAAGGGTVLFKSNGKAISSTLTIGPGLNVLGADANFAACTPATCPNPSSWPLIKTGDYRAINFSTVGVRSLRFVRIEGTDKATATTAGIYVSTAALNMDHVDVSGYQFALYVTAGGSVSIGGGVHLHDSHEGLKATDGGSAAGGTVSVDVTTGSDPTDFNDNDYGIMCNGSTKLSVSGPPNSAATPGLLAVSGNTLAGVYWNATQAKPVGVLDGLEIQGNGTTGSDAYHGGVIIFTQSAIKLRNNYIHGNHGSGVYVVPAGDATSDGVAQIDLGVGVGAGAGRNTFAKNDLAGLCLQSAVALAAANMSLRADGNIFGAASTGDCTKMGKYSHAKACSAGIDYSGACSAAITLSNCSASNTCQ